MFPTIFILFLFFVPGLAAPLGEVTGDINLETSSGELETEVGENNVVSIIVMTSEEVESSFLAEDVELSSTTLTLINASDVGVVLEVNVSQNCSSAFEIIKYRDNPTDKNVEGKVGLNFFKIEMSNKEYVSEIRLRLYYNDSEVSQLGIDENSLRAYRFNLTTSQWVCIGGQVNSNENYVYVVTRDLSLWGLFGTSLRSSRGTSSGGEGGVNGGGGGGGFIPPTTCEPNWSCTEWSECYPNGTQYRKCVDLNNCGSTEGKPEEVRRCRYSGNITELQGMTKENMTENITVVPECGNGICESGEDQLNCCLDCGCPKGYKCEMNKCIKMTQKEKGITKYISITGRLIQILASPLVVVIVGLGIVGCAILFFFKRRR